MTGLCAGDKAGECRTGVDFGLLTGTPMEGTTTGEAVWPLVGVTMGETFGGDTVGILGVTGGLNTGVVRGVVTGDIVGATFGSLEGANTGKTTGDELLFEASTGASDCTAPEAGIGDLIGADEG
jgi:hypothetical protein